jgi:outer membrane protein TolC
VEAEKARLSAWRDYWIARARLEKALGGSMPAAPARAASAEGETR